MPRDQLDGGLLPEETHHDEAALTEFFESEKQRRIERQKEAVQEIMAQREMGHAASMTKGSPSVNAGVHRSPGAVVTPKRKYVRKKPAAANGKHKRRVTVAKKPSRA